jgi:UDP-N-acetyl-D-glucosamine dehydrogenase
MGQTVHSPERFKGSSLKIGVIGCGYVGLPLLLRFAERGHQVCGFDTDPEKVEKLNAGKSYIKHIPAEMIKGAVDQGRFAATTDFTRLKDVDAILICVPTPLDNRREPDLSYVEHTAQAVSQNLQQGQLVVL